MREVGGYAKAILRILLKKAIENGSPDVFLDYREISKELSVDNRNFLKICVHYLYDGKYLQFIRESGEDVRLVQLTAAGIDLAEN